MNLKTNLKITTFILLFIGVVTTTWAQTANQKFKKVKALGGIEEYLYEPNGLNLLLVQDNAAPVVTVQIVYRVGSKHEVTGNTGSTHLLEHLNFKGTEKFNKRKGTSIDSKLNSIGAQMNATTWNDRTNYYETIPSDKIEIALEIEADRMRNSLLLQEDKEAEMTVVRNEFERGENNPNQVLSKEIWAAAYMAHPYHHSTIGWRSDIENMPIEVLREFYDTYYWPNNATLTIIGDFQKDHLFNLVDKYFGKISKAPHSIPQPYTEEPEQMGPRKIVVKKPGQQAVINVAYKIPGRMHDDLPALTVLGKILGSGANSILSKAYLDTGKAYYAYASPSEFQDAGLFTVGIGFGPDVSHENLNKELLETLEQVKNEGVKQEDVNRVVANINAREVLSRDGSGSIAGQLTEAIAGGDWTDYVTASQRLKSVTAEDVKRVANKYLVEDQSTTGYFIPDMPGANAFDAQEAMNYTDLNFGKFYYRHPEGHKEQPANPVKASHKLMVEEPVTKSTDTQNNFTRTKVEGIDVITAKTGAKDFVTIAASFPIGAYLNTGLNETVPSLTAQMLSKGTTKNDKFQLAEKLESLGVSLNINAQTNNVKVFFKCLKKDVSEVISILAEELRYPLFDESEFQLLKEQIIGDLKQDESDPNTQGAIALSQIIYPKGHPNYYSSIATSVKNIEDATIDDLKAFHKSYFGPKGMHLVAVGDIETQELYKALEKGFNKWEGGLVEAVTYTSPVKAAATTKVITIPQKPSAELFIGQYTGIKRDDKDFMPFYIGNSILGAGFSGRLMLTVRDEQGLTYSIKSSHSGHSFAGGYWEVNASFNPSLFQNGLDATMEQVVEWRNNGVTAQELAAKKSNLMGAFKVGLSTTMGLAGTILNFVERGLEPSYINQYPEDIKAVTLEQVNTAIKKHIDLDKLIIIKSGSLDQKGAPLN